MIQVLVSALFVVGLVAPRALYRAGTDTAAPLDTAPADTSPADSGTDTGADTGTPTDTASTDTADTGLEEGPLWGAAALSGEPGGCGCSSASWGGGGPAPLRNASPALAGVLALALVRRRRG